MSICDDMVALETKEKNGNQYRIIHTNKFNGLFFSYIDDNVHGESPPTRLVEYFENCNYIKNNFPENIAVIHSDCSWDEIKSNAKKYAKSEIEAILKRSVRSE